jgi:peptidoglycan hydrolase-like protein with peptidoglycan-binding domain
MASYTMLQNGSSGEDVRKLQNALVGAGYNVGSTGADGIFGSNTAAAVRKYQQDNGLSVDGIAGDKTLGKLYGTAQPAANNGAGNSAASAAQNVQPKFEYKSYEESDAVKKAETMLNEQLASKPGEYQSQWQAQLNDTINKILNREEFSYDLNGDALYQQYKDQYTAQGKKAMMDTMGQAAALTGGYGNSYAETVGNQAYQSYLQQLNDKIPELYKLAYDRYNQEGQNLYDQYSMLGTQEGMEYDRYRDKFADWQAERDYLANRYNAERDYDYNRYTDDRNYNYGVFADDRDYAYQVERDKIADKQWQAQFDEAKRQYDQQYALSSSGGSGGRSSGGGSSSGGGYNNGSLTAAQVRELQSVLGVDADGLYGSGSQAAAGGLSADEAYARYVGGSGAGKGSSQQYGYASMREESNSGYSPMSEAEWLKRKARGDKAASVANYRTFREYLTDYNQYVIEGYSH